MKKGIAVLLALLLLLSLVGCGAKSELSTSDMAMEVPAEEPAAPEEAPRISGAAMGF